jgi:acetoin utilization deacetylase AcuC-like enzyme
MLVVTDPRCLRHRVPPGFPEVPRRLSGILEGLAADQRVEAIVEASGVGDDEVLAAAEEVHDPSYLERFRRAVARGDGLLDTADNPLSSETWAAALGAAGAALGALDRAVESSAAVFAAVRPPGHHAERAGAMGFCFLNNAALAVERARSRHGLGRVAVVDFDVHHGNGTQHLFEERGDVLYVSLHQWPFYPGTGAASERGRGAGEGATLNLPLPAGSGDAEWLGALDAEVLPALDRFAPELLVASAGFDAWQGDPLGGMRLSAEGFAAIGRRLGDAAERLCAGRRLDLLEGGYDLAALPRLVRAYLFGTDPR